MRASIIIAVKGFNDNLKNCIRACLELAYEDYEIIVLPDETFSYAHEKVRIIPTGPCLPAKKRDVASPYATGEVLAFLDDDAAPVKDWLAEAMKNFNDPFVAAVAGPAITPPDEGLMEEASGLVYESFAFSGHFRYRYRKAKRQLVDDYPSCNLLVRKQIFDQLGGFKTNFWPGEDTILCLEITKRLKKNIVYDPEAVVFHHRRPLWAGHLKQICNYALHRGYFAKRFPETSRRWPYFVPSVFVLWLLAGAVFCFFNVLFSAVYLGILTFYAVFIILSSFRKNSLRLTGLVFLGIISSHLCYGIYFIRGLLSPRLKEEIA